MVFRMNHIYTRFLSPK